MRRLRVAVCTAGVAALGSVLASALPASAATAGPAAAPASANPAPTADFAALTGPVTTAPATTTPTSPARPAAVPQPATKPSHQTTTTTTSKPKQSASQQSQQADLDLTLVKDKSGVHPRQAQGLVMRLSPGGPGDLARLGAGANSIALGWGGYPLPTPVLNGALAIYPDVVMGGDLRVQATAAGFKVSVVLATPPPGPVVVTLPIVAKGISAGQAPDGDLVFTDPVANVVSRSPAPEMVAANVAFGALSRMAPAAATATATAFGPGALTYVVSPSPAWLADPATAYPVTVDLATIYAPTMPLSYLGLYQSAAQTCAGLPWSVLAAIGFFETDHGRSTAPGVHQGANIAGAEGPMQFLPATFAVYDTPPAPGGAQPPSPYDPPDAIYAAARNLCANGGGDASTLAGAVFAYNHADWYVNEVLTLAAAYDSLLPPASSPGGSAVRFALAHIGEPYLFGGNGPGSYDCSGLLQAAFASAGRALPRGAQDQFGSGPHLGGGAPLRPGDGVFFGSGPGGIEHDGIYLGSGLMINAPHTGASLRIDNFAWSDYVGATRPVTWSPPAPPPPAGAPVPAPQPGSLPNPGPALV